LGLQCAKKSEGLLILYLFDLIVIHDGHFFLNSGTKELRATTEIGKNHDILKDILKDIFRRMPN
jgi:hypothetical protein